VSVCVCVCLSLSVCLSLYLSVSVYVCVRVFIPVKLGVVSFPLCVCLCLSLSVCVCLFCVCLRLSATVCVSTSQPLQVHFVLYFVELTLLTLGDDTSLFATHIGQRLTTLWFQLLQPPRYGQHLQMHLETLMQIADCMNLHQVERKRMRWLYVFFGFISLGIYIQNALTSLAYHSMAEQTWGFGLFLAKYLYFDLSYRGNKVCVCVCV
jgi:hypothetical protein